MDDLKFEFWENIKHKDSCCPCAYVACHENVRENGDVTSLILDFGSNWSLLFSCFGRFTPSTHYIRGLVGNRACVPVIATKIRPISFIGTSMSRIILFLSLIKDSGEFRYSSMHS